LPKRIAHCLTKPKAINNKYSWLKAQRKLPTQNDSNLKVKRKYNIFELMYI